MITSRYSAPFYTGEGASGSAVPGLFAVSINGVGYEIDEHSNELYREHFHDESLDILRQQADTSGQPGEASITPEGLWRRAADDWAHGAGQTRKDHPSSDPSRFRSSKGINPWNRWALTLLGDTASAKSSSNTNLAVAVAGVRIYLIDGQTLSYATDITVASPTWTAVTGTPVQTGGSITSDGTNVWVVYAGANGIYKTDVGSGAATAYVTSAVNGPIGYVKGRLMAASSASIYNITGAGALPAALFTHGNASFAWVGFAEGTGQIYAAGYAGDKSWIYRCAVKTDGTALDAPVVAGELPSGEIVRSITGYLGYVVIGTDRGVRFAQATGSGDLVIGALIPTTSAVSCATGQDRFVYFAWTNYDGTSTGLGRLDLTVFTATLTPAYASDLMVTAQGAVSSVATFQSRRVLCVSASGVWVEQTVKVASGTLDSGAITYGLPDVKAGMFLDLSAEPLVGSITASVSSDGSTFGALGGLTTTGATSTVLNVNQLRARTFETRMTLARASSADTVGPTLDRATLRAYPVPTIGKLFVVPILLHEEVVLSGGTVVHYDVARELERFDSLANSRALVNYSEGSLSYQVFVDSINFIKHHRSTNKATWNGTMIAKLKYLPGS